MWSKNAWLWTLPVIIIISKETIILLVCEQIQMCNHQTGTFEPYSAQKIV